MSGVTLSKAPEYYMNVLIAQAINKTFPNVGFRLEMPVEQLTKRFGLEESQIKYPEKLRYDGKFDIVLTSKKTHLPRHIIEVKRHIGPPALRKEARRIAATTIQKHFRKQLTTGFIATISRIKGTAQTSIQENWMTELKCFLRKLLIWVNLWSTVFIRTLKKENMDMLKMNHF